MLKWSIQKTEFTLYKMKSFKLKILFSVLPLLLIGYFFAKYVGVNKEAAWIYIAIFYASWIIISLAFLVTFDDIKQMFSPSKNWQWNLLFIPFIILLIIFIFIPNIKLLKLDHWLLLNIIICLINPFMEEIYWRGLVSKISDVPVYSFLFSSLTFAASHPLLFGIVSVGVSGWIGFAGAFFVGALLWFCYYKTRSLRGCVINHFLIDVSGMAVYILANKAVLAPLSGN